MAISEKIARAVAKLVGKQAVETVDTLKEVLDDVVVVGRSVDRNMPNIITRSGQFPDMLLAKAFGRAEAGPESLKTLGEGITFRTNEAKELVNKASDFLERKDRYISSLLNSEEFRALKRLGEESPEKYNGIINKRVFSVLKPTEETQRKINEFVQNTNPDELAKLDDLVSAYTAKRKELIDKIVTARPELEESLKNPLDFFTSSVRGDFKLFTTKDLKPLTENSEINPFPSLVTDDPVEVARYIVNNNLKGKNIVVSGFDFPDTAIKALGTPGSEVRTLFEEVQRLKATGGPSLAEAKIKLRDALIKEAKRSEEPTVAFFRPLQQLIPFEKRFTPDKEEAFIRWLGNIAAREESGYKTALESILSNPVVKGNPELVHAFKDYDNLVSGHPIREARGFLTFLNAIGAPKALTQNLVKNILLFQASTKIGLNPLTWAINMFQPFTNLLPVIGFKRFAQTYNAFIRNAKVPGGIRARELLSREGYTVKEPGLTRVVEGLSSRELKDFASSILYKPLIPFQAIEMVHNRGLAFLAGYTIKAEELAAKRGISATAAMKIPALRKEAIDEGHRLARFINFVYDPSNRIGIFNLEPLRPLTQFKTFLVKQIRFLDYLLEDAIARGNYRPLATFLGMYMLAGGALSVPVIGSFARLFPETSGTFELENPVLARGLPAAAGVEVSTPLGISTPVPSRRALEEGLGGVAKEAGEFLAGPTIGQAGQFVATTAREGIKEAGKEFLEGIVPPFRRARRIKEIGGEPALVTKQGNVITKGLTPTEKKLITFGVRPIRATQTLTAKNLQRLAIQRFQRERMDAIRDIALAFVEGDTDRGAQLFREANSREITVLGRPVRLAITPKDIRAWITEHTQPINQRIRRIPKRLRGPLVPQTVAIPQ